MKMESKKLSAQPQFSQKSIIDLNDSLLGNAKTLLDAMRNNDLTLDEHNFYMDQIQEAIEHGMRIESELYTDPVTGGHNRKSFMKGMDQAIQKMRSDSKLQYSIVFADLDGFKAVNDSCGHEEGDEALLEADLRLSDAVQDGDIVARLGGDEYVILLKHKDGRDMDPAAVRFRTQRIFDGMVCWDLSDPRNEMPYPIGVSVGVVGFDRDVMNGMGNAEYAAYVLAQADKAMYADKAQKESRLVKQRYDILNAVTLEWDLAA